MEIRQQLRKDKKSKEKLLYKLQLPLLQNDIFNKMNNVTKTSENLYRSINHFSTEGNMTYESEKNKMKFINEIMNE